MSKRYVTRGFMGVMGVLIAMFAYGAVLHADTNPPEGAVTAELGFPPVETTLVFKIRLQGRAALPHLGDTATKETIQEGVSFTEYHTVLEESTQGAKPVHRVTDGKTIRLMDKATGNWIGLVRAHKEFTYDKTKDDMVMTISEGEKLFSASPYIAGFAFPLWVGKSWKIPYTFYSHNEETTSKHVWQGKVTAYEDVTVPAGTSKAFKVEGTDGNLHLVSWYAPTQHIVVKAIFEYLPGHISSPGQRTVELVEYATK
ncbi:MAG: hypothetical protein OEU26_26210 [Candidatus Tectomicrobia bacterium]|nr:hypothetical protein [Candidatus Tectomicrobia bacterium]